MADISIVINPAETISANILPPNSVSVGTADSYPPHASTHAPEAYDSLSSYYVGTGDLTGYVNKNQTGYLSGTFYPYSANPAGYVQGAVVRPSNTGQFVSTGKGSQLIDGHKTFIGSVTLGADGQAGYPVLTSQGYGFFTFLGQNGGNYAEPAIIAGVNYLSSPYQTESSISMDCGGGDGISISANSINLYSPTRPTYNGSGIMLLGETGQFVSTGSTGQFVTGSVVRPSQTGVFLTTGAADGRYALQTATGNFVTTAQTGQFLVSSQTGTFLTTGAADSRYALQSATGSFVTTGQTGQFVTGNVVRPSDTGTFLTTGAADGRYALQSSTGSFVTTSQTGQFVSTGSTGNFVTGNVVRPSETGSFLITGAADNRYALQSATGNFVTTSQTGNFVITAQTGAFLTTGAADGRYALQSATGNFATSSSVVSLTGNQDVSGVKNFFSRLTVSGTGVLLSGESVTTQPNDANLIIGLSLFI
jgi:hypothetical protein